MCRQALAVIITPMFFEITGAFADVKINVTEKLTFVLGRVENIVGKGENAGYQHFLFFLQCFQKVSFLGVSLNTQSPSLVSVKTKERHE